MAFKLGDSRGNPIQNAKNPNHKLVGGKPNGNNQVLTYKKNKDYFDNRAVYHPNPKYNDQIRQRVYSGKYGFNPQTGALTKLNPTEQKGISESEKKYTGKPIIKEGPRSIVKARQYHADGTPVDMTQKEIEEYVETGTRKLMHTGSNIIQNLPGVETIGDILHLGKSLATGDLEGAKWSAAGLFLPVSGKALRQGYNKLKSKKPNPSSFSKTPTHYKNDPLGTEAVDARDAALGTLYNRGKTLDEDYGYFDYRNLGPENVKFHGVKDGRSVVEVEMPDGNTQLFYKSTDLSRKGVEGMWQPFGGYMNAPGDFFVDEVLDNAGNVIGTKTRPREQWTKDWLIKDGGYKSWYDSNTYREVAGELNRISLEGGYDMSEQILRSEQKVKKVQPHKR